MNHIERKLKKYAMLYLSDLLEDLSYESENVMTLEEFINSQEYTFSYKEEQTPFGQIYGTLSILQYGETEAQFTMCIARQKEVTKMHNINGMVTMEIRNVSYVDRPNAIRKFLANGFSIDDIVVTRVDACHYDMVAIR